MLLAATVVFWPLVSAFEFTAIQPLTNSEMRLTLSGPKNKNVRIDTSQDLQNWRSLVTVTSDTQVISYTDSGAPYSSVRTYRAVQLESNILSGDVLPTTVGDVIIHPVNHATFVIQWNDLWIYNDPVGGAAKFRGLPKADLVLLSHIHGDHFEVSTINAIRKPASSLVAPKAVFSQLSKALQTNTIVLANGESTVLQDLKIEAIASYNLTQSFHPKGQGNGYILNIGEKRIYISGDTEDIPEMRALRDIDVAFLSMNLPYTMSIPRAVSAVREFKPKVVYPYHYQGADLTPFKPMVGQDQQIEVRLRPWY